MGMRFTDTTGILALHSTGTSIELQGLFRLDGRHQVNLHDETQ